MIWLYYDDNIGQRELFDLDMILSTQRMQQMQRYRFQKDRSLCMIAYMLLRIALYAEYHITEPPAVISSPRQKPVFQSLPYQFNLSHCDCAVACVLDTAPVGIEVQHHADDLCRIKTDILTEQEIGNAGNTVYEITRFWTLKEAYGKYSGCGLCYDYRHTDFSDIHKRYAWQRYQERFVLSCLNKHYAMSVFSDKPLAVQTVTNAALFQFAKLITQKEVTI